MWNNVKWFRTFLIFFCNNKNLIKINKLFKGEFLFKPFGKELIFISLVFSNITNSELWTPLIQIAYQNFISTKTWNFKLVHNLRRNQLLISDIRAGTKI